MQSAVAERKQTGRRTSVINIRTSDRQRSLIDQAAAAQGKSRSDFMLEAAQQAAVDTLLNQTLFQVDEKTFKRFTSALDAPPKANAKLRKLMQSKSPWEK